MKKKIMLGVVIFLLLVFQGITYGNQQEGEEKTVKDYVVQAEVLNVRQGPSKNQEVMETLKKGTKVTVLSAIGDWYVIQTPSEKVGCVAKEFVQEKQYVLEGDTQNGITEMTELETKLLTLINEKRKENNLLELTIDDELQNVARLKAAEMVEKEYFSHTSPEYGSPFAMMQTMGISYKVAGENIAGNVSVEEAVKAWMNSEGHKDNILDNGYNYTGIGIANSSKYGKIFVQMFIGK